MATQTKLLTAEEFMCLPEPPEGGKMELIHGEIVTMAPTGGDHGRKAGRLLAKLLPFIERHALGDVGVEVGYLLKRKPDLVRAPDVSFAEVSRLKDGRFPDTYVDGPPTLAVEVVSPNDHDDHVATKVEEYLAAGTERVWVVRPKVRTITVHRPDGDAHTYRAGDKLNSDDAGFPVEGFALPVDEVFA